MWERTSKYGTATRSKAPPRIYSWHFVMELEQHIVEGQCGSGGRRVRGRSSIADLAGRSNRCVRWQRKRSCLTTGERGHCTDRLEAGRKDETQGIVVRLTLDSS